MRLRILSRIPKESSHCPLCGLFYHVVNRQGAVYRHRSAYGTLDSSDVEFRADPDLSAATSPDNPMADFDDALQLSDVGTFSASVEHPATHPFPSSCSLISPSPAPISTLLAVKP